MERFYHACCGKTFHGSTASTGQNDATDTNQCIIYAPVGQWKVFSEARVTWKAFLQTRKPLLNHHSM